MLKRVEVNCFGRNSQLQNRLQRGGQLLAERDPVGKNVRGFPANPTGSFWEPITMVGDVGELPAFRGSWSVTTATAYHDAFL